MTLARRAVVVVVVGVAAAAVWPGAATSATSPKAAQTWYRHVIKDLHPLQSTLIGALDATSAWAAGSESAVKTRQELQRDLPTLERVHRSLEHLQAVPGHASARDDYAAAIGLYDASLRVDEAATEEPSGPLQEQLQHGSQRLRALGDIVFDQGTAELAPQLGATLAGSDVAAASHVPDWSSDGLAPGPPLAASWSPGPSSASGSQPRSEWAAAVARDGAPPQTAVQAAVAGHPLADVGATVVALGAAESSLGSQPGPAGDPLAANRQRLGLLVDAEGLMAEEAAHLSHAAPARTLAAVATSVVAIGGRLRAES